MQLAVGHDRPVEIDGHLPSGKHVGTLWPHSCPQRTERKGKRRRGQGSARLRTHALHLQNELPAIGQSGGEGQDNPTPAPIGQGSHHPTAIGFQTEAIRGRRGHRGAKF